MNQKEEDAIKKYQYCNNIQERTDLVFIYPSEFSKDPNVIANKLQKCVDWLKNITSIDPTEIFGQRVIIAYRHQNDEGGDKQHPIWTKNRISIPWKYLNKLEEPLYSCTHELVHPFFRCSPINNRNEAWGEGFCEFLRGPLNRLLGLNGLGWWLKTIKVAEKNIDSSYMYPAGHFVLKAYEDYKTTYGNKTLDDFINDDKAIGAYVKSIFFRFQSISLSTYITPSPKMKSRWGTNKI